MRISASLKQKQVIAWPLLFLKSVAKSQNETDGVFACVECALQAGKRTSRYPLRSDRPVTARQFWLNVPLGGAPAAPHGTILEIISIFQLVENIDAQDKRFSLTRRPFAPAAGNQIDQNDVLCAFRCVRKSVTAIQGRPPRISFGVAESKNWRKAGRPLQLSRV